MLAPLKAAVQADVGRQVGWAKGEARRQARYAALIGILAGAGALASVGAGVVGLIALHSWLAIKTGPFVAHGIIGLALLLLAVVLFGFVFVRRPPRLAARSPLQLLRYHCRTRGPGVRQRLSRRRHKRTADLEFGCRYAASRFPVGALGHARACLRGWTDREPQAVADCQR
jgi:hypothetical protein